VALMSPQVVSVAGLTPAYTTPTVSDTITPGTNLWLHVKTTSERRHRDPGRRVEDPGGRGVGEPHGRARHLDERLIGPLDSDLANTSTG
jgi:hypothetical protein